MTILTRADFWNMQNEFVSVKIMVNSFHATCQRVADVFSGYRKRPVVYNW